MQVSALGLHTINLNSSKGLQERTYQRIPTLKVWPVLRRALNSVIVGKVLKSEEMVVIG